jgi:hypothetical protein
MISGFLVTSIIEILIYYRVPFPKKTEYYFNLMSALIQLVIMRGHTSEDGVENLLHALWTVLITCTFAIGCCEVYDPDCFWTVYCRICLALTQGSWLMQVAFVLWPHTDDPRFIWVDSHNTHVWMNIYLMFHLIIAACTLMGVYLLVYYTIWFFDRCYSRYEHDLEVDNSAQPIKFSNYETNDSKEYSMLLNSADDDCAESKN